MTDFEERQLKISFDELNTKLNNCIQKIQNSSFIENEDAGNDFENCLNEYSQLRKDFQAQSFCYDENLCGRFDKEATENDHLRKLAFGLVKEKLQLLYEHPEVKGRKRIADLLCDFCEQVEYTMPFKIYALSTFISALPYCVPEEELAKSSYKFDPAKKEIKWRFVGFAESIFEAWYYVQQDTCSGISLEIDGKKNVCHLLSEPSDEYYNDFVKIESEYYTEYFDIYAPSPIGQMYGYRKTEYECFFCGKKFEGHGYDIHPVKYYFERNFGFERCCDGCHKKYLDPLKQRMRMSEEEKLQRENKIKELRFKYFLELPEFEE